MQNTLQTSLKNKSSSTTEKGMGRVSEILEAARHILASEGYAGLSMRKVASEVGISLSNVQHYFQSKDVLMEAVLLMTMNQFQEKIDHITSAMKQQPRIDQLDSAISMFLEELSNPVTYGMFFEIWALAARNAFASALMDKMIARERKAIFKLIQGLNPAISDDEYKLRATLIVAQVEGLMLFRYHRQTQKTEMLAVHAALKRSIIALASRL
ncbi:TetR/AcrR family transcriptional regulator [Undibacterium sp. RuRC25W]|uniref:TetR/AcrR family transcriptional regulator n=1 Tax=Undibacterium sp. RuRC25W TaxID=3413047 RepID=UPI003BEF9BFF